jgi:glycosyltransferase involved in cell wall biosynthesis
MMHMRGQDWRINDVFRNVGGVAQSCDGVQLSTTPTTAQAQGVAPMSAYVDQEEIVTQRSYSLKVAISVVVPVYNEEGSIDEFHHRLSSVMSTVHYRWEVVYVNDGSRDGTLAALDTLRAQDPHVSILNLSRNFGKEIAMTAGLDHARGDDAVIVIDADLQDPPELIPELVAGWRRGFDIVYAQRGKREGESRLKKTTAALFYRLMNVVANGEMPSNTGDFRLMSRRVVNAVVRLREQHRFMKGIFAWVGFRSLAVPYDRAPRAAGVTKWNYWKLWNLAIEGITSFTVLPLKAATYVGLLVAVVALTYGTYFFGRTLLYGNPVAGYPSLLVIILFLGGIQLMTLGVIGEYLGRIFNETKQRPLYLVASVVTSHSVVREGCREKDATATAAPCGTLGAHV